MVIEVKQNGKFVKIPYITADVPVSEAPIDGKQYARQDATWSEIVIPEVDLTEVETNIAANTQAIAANTADIATLNSTVSNLPTAGSIVVTTDPRLTAATTTKAGLMTAADKVQLDSTLTATEIENKVNAAVSSVYRVKGNVATVDGIQAAGFCKYNRSIIASEFTDNDFGYGYKTNGWYTSGPAWSVGDSSGDHVYVKQFQGNANTNVLHMRTISDSVASSWREFAFKDDNVVLTQAEYNALGSTVNSDNKIYFIKE